MKKLLTLIAVILLASSSAHAGLKAVSSSGGGAPNVSTATGTLPVANGGTGSTTASAALANLQGLKAWQNKRVPTGTDDSTAGYANSQLWSYGGQFWNSVATANAGDANWQIQQLSSAPVCNLVSGCTAAYGVFKLVNAYAGNAFEVTRASDSTQLAIGFDSNGYANWSALDAFCLATTCTVDTWYDQTANGYNLTQGTVGSQPRIMGNYVANQRAITFDGNNSQRSLANTSLIITDRLNVSVFMIAKTAGGGGGSGNALFDVGSPTARFTAFSPQATVGAVGTSAGLNYAYNGGSSTSFNVAMRGVTSQLISLVNTAGTVVQCQNNFCSTGSVVLATQAATGLFLGGTQLIGYPGKYDITAFVIYNSALNAANQQIVRQSLYQTTGIQPQINDNVTIIGDSITCCTTTAGVAPSQIYEGMLAAQFDKPVNFYNFGIGSELLTTMASNVSTFDGYTFVSGANNINVIFGGTNDLAAGSSTGAQVYASMQTACTNAHSAGFKCVVVSPFPRNAGFTNGVTQATFEVQRQVVISSLQSNNAFADGFSDCGSDPVMGPIAASSNGALYPDAIHPSAPLGTSYTAACVARGLKPLLQ